MLLNNAKVYEMLHLVKAKRMRTIKLSVHCYVTRKGTWTNFCFSCYHLNFMKKPQAVKIMHMSF